MQPNHRASVRGAVLVGLLAALAPPATAQQWAITLSALSADGVSTELSSDSPNVVTGETATLTVSDGGAAGFAGLTAGLTLAGAMVTPIALAGDNPKVGTIQRPTVMAGTSLALGTGGPTAFQAFVEFPLAVAAGGDGGASGTAPPAAPPTVAPPIAKSPPPTPPPADAGAATAAQLTFLCDDRQVRRLLRARPEGLLDANDGLHLYQEGVKKAEAWIVVTPLGMVLYSGLDQFDENDRLRVLVVGHPDLLPKLKVKRTSAFGQVGQIRIVGAQQVDELLTRQAGVDCASRDFLITDFAPGQGAVGISARLAADEDTALGSFDFNVHPLYSGMFTIGAASSDLVDPSFRLVSTGGEEMRIVAGQEGKDEIQYTLFYTPFVWGKRDLEKRVPVRQRFNPSLGIVPDDVSSHALVGLTVDVGAGIAITVGIHFREITVLSPESGLSPGDVFVPPAGNATPTLPTATKWEDDSFFAVSWDLRAVAGLFKSALTGG